MDAKSVKITMEQGNGRSQSWEFSRLQLLTMTGFEYRILQVLPYNLDRLWKGVCKERQEATHE